VASTGIRGVPRSGSDASAAPRSGHHNRLEAMPRVVEPRTPLMAMDYLGASSEFTAMGYHRPVLPEIPRRDQSVTPPGLGNPGEFDLATHSSGCE
jgi:hypothetical protein